MEVKSKKSKFKKQLTIQGLLTFEFDFIYIYPATPPAGQHKLSYSLYLLFQGFLSSCTGIRASLPLIVTVHKTWCGCSITSTI